MYSFFERKTYVCVIDNVFCIYSTFNQQTHKPMSAVTHVADGSHTSPPAQLEVSDLMPGLVYSTTASVLPLMVRMSVILRITSLVLVQPPILATRLTPMTLGYLSSQGI